VFPSALLLAASAALAAAPGTGAQEAAPGDPPATALHHRIAVAVDPGNGSLAATDELSGEAIGDEVVFALHAALAVRADSPAWTIEPLSIPGDGPQGGIDHRSEEEGGVGRRTWRARRNESGAGAPLRIAYQGVIAHPISREGEEYARSFSSSPGIIGEEGVALGAAAAWVPEIGARLFTYELEVALPAGWDAVSQGDRVAREKGESGTRTTWRVATPTEEVHLIAGRYHEWTRPAGGAEAQVFLRSPDESLAAKYLEVTAQYLAMYSSLIGPYPYGKFALVENFWETGYGMPSFTLLGPQVIRLPFILHSSYPHEILHNWWGNSVYVDFDGGNWCEGLTAYLADHLVKEGQGQGEEYRRDVLEKYRSYVREGHEIALAEFLSRHSGATEAVGYGKSLMLWHMLRRDLGDEKFVAALRRLYRRHRYERVSFAMIERIFSETAGRDLAPVFAQWVGRKGAPELALEVDPLRTEEGEWEIRVSQVQEEPPYLLTVPVAALLEGSEIVQWFTVPFLPASGPESAARRMTLSIRSRPLWVAVDPAFDLFRRLHAEEVQPSLGDLFGAPRALVVLPAGDGEPDWAAFASAWDPDGERLEVVSESELETLPADRPVWILGRDNRHAAAVRDGARARGATLDGETLRFGAESVPAAGHCFAVVERHPAAPALAIGWIAADLEGALPGLARKLPHYGKYSYLVFAGEEPANVIKGEWPSNRSPLVWRAPGFDGPAPVLPEREPLARLAPVFDPAALLSHVRALADPALEGRAAGSEGAARSAAMIEEAFRAAGLAPGGSAGSYIDEWTEAGPAGPLTLRNVVGVLPGTRAELTGAVVVGAHYDHLGRGWPDVRAGEEGKIHPGADDNASGVAVLIEVAKLLAGGHRPARPIVFVAFDGEEWQRRGSKHFAAGSPHAKGALAMISLDAVGRLGERKLLVLGTGTASEWIHIARGIGFTTGIESTAVADDPGGSDQVSFHEIGVPGVQLTSGPHEDYHRPSDTVEKIDAAGLVDVATWLREALVYLGDRAEPLTSNLGSGTGAPAPAAAGEGRRVSLGTVPDFADPGPGVRIESVLPGSPAEKAGLRAGDRIVAIGGRAIADLRAYSEVLKAHAPGDTITIEFERDGERESVEATLIAR